QCSIQFRRIQPIMSVDAQFQRGTDDVCAAARRHDFFMGGHERRAHDASVFKAAAAAVTLFQGADERTIFERLRELGTEWKLQRLRKVFAQMVVDSVLIPVRFESASKNFSRIENVLRIKHSLDLAHYSEQLISELLSHVFRARDADTVLSGKRAFKLAHQCRG